MSKKKKEPPVYLLEWSAIDNLDILITMLEETNRKRNKLFDRLILAEGLNHSTRKDTKKILISMASLSLIISNRTYLLIPIYDKYINIDKWITQGIEHHLRILSSRSTHAKEKSSKTTTKCYSTEDHHREKDID